MPVLITNSVIIVEKVWNIDVGDYPDSDLFVLDDYLVFE